VVTHPEARTKGEDPMATEKSTAHPAHPSTEDHDETVEAHYASLERPHVCCEGVIYIGHLVEDPGTGEEVEVIEAVLPPMRGEPIATPR
jgi:hypothetical protein